jgi:hypothetical protein
MEEAQPDRLQSRTRTGGVVDDVEKSSVHADKKIIL